MTSLPRHLSCQLVRYCANWQFYWSVCAVLALTALFAVLDVQTISSTVSITQTVPYNRTTHWTRTWRISCPTPCSPRPTRPQIILIPIIVAFDCGGGIPVGR